MSTARIHQDDADPTPGWREVPNLGPRLMRAACLVYGMAPGSFSTVDLLSRGINELLFPVGCALVLFSAEPLGEKSATGNAEG